MSQVQKISPKLAEALALHEQGRVQEAEARYARILKNEPANVVARYQLGLARLQRGDFEGGIASLSRLLKFEPEHLEAHFNLGRAYGMQGKHAEALSHFLAVIKQVPDVAEARFYLGMTLAQLGRQNESLEHFRYAIRLQPGMAEAHHNLGSALSDLGRDKDAIQAFEEALKASPGLVDSLLGLGKSLNRLGRFDLSMPYFKQAIVSRPDCKEAYLGLGEALLKIRQYAAACVCFERLVALQPGDVEANVRLAVAYKEAACFDKADAAFRHALALETEVNDPEILMALATACREMQLYDRAKAYFHQALDRGGKPSDIYRNIGINYLEQGRQEEALATYEQAIQCAPDDWSAHFGRGLVLLAMKDFKEGWQEYEYGLKSGDRDGCPSDFPRWEGGELEGKTLLLCAEQGLGDEIMFASILPEIVEMAGQCVVECDERMLKLYARSFPQAQLIGREARRSSTGSAIDLDCSALPHIDVQLPVGSLPLYRRRGLEAFPRHHGYLKADPRRIDYWRERLDALGPGLKIGISWKGGTPRTGMRRRSIPLPELMSVLTLPGVRFVSLQYGACQGDLEALAREYGIEIVHWQEAVDDYDEAAALVCALDLVISVQTAVVHLCGALGRPAWVMLPIPAEWRYMASGDSMPWYPSVRLFRQQEQGEWQDVIERVATELDKLANKSG